MARVAMGAVSGNPAVPTARVTIVVSLREGHGLALSALDHLIAHTPTGTPILYLDIASPPPIRAQLERRAARHGFTLLRFEAGTWPTTARAAIVDRLVTDYVVFIENDVLVAPGWLEAMVRCADETGAGLVGPLYLEGGGAEPMTVHMAGGDLVRRATPAGETIDESHRLMHAPLATAGRCIREQCGFVEFHCLLARRSIFARGISLDRGFGCVHEHIDLSLQVAELGLPIYMEPAARVLQMRDGDYLLSDLPLLRWRWNETAVEASIASFCKLWRIAADEEAFRGVRTFTRDRRRQLDPVHSDLAHDRQPDEAAPAQTRDALQRQMTSAGYSNDDIWRAMTACDLAEELHRNSYDGDGRPFVAHPIGAGSLLVQHRFAASTVATALLHAAISHGRSGADGPTRPERIAERIVTACGATTAKRVHDVTRLIANPRKWLARHRDLSALRMSTAVTLPVAAAVLIDALSSRSASDGRPSKEDYDWCALFDATLQSVGRPALAEKCRQVLLGGSAWLALADRRHACWHRGASDEKEPLDSCWTETWLRQPPVYAGRRHAADPCPVATPRRTATG